MALLAVAASFPCPDKLRAADRGKSAKAVEVVFPALTLESLENIARSEHPVLRQAAARIDAARGKWLQAGLPPNPRWGYSGQQLGSRGLAEQHGVLIEQNLIRGGKLQASRQVAEHEVEQAEREFVAQEMRVLTDLRVAFVETLVAQRRREFTEDLERISREAASIADSLFAAKEVSRVDVVQARLELQQAQVAARVVRTRHEAAWRQLAAIVGQPDLTIRPIDGDLTSEVPDLEWDAVLNRLWQESPEIAVALAGLARARSAVVRAVAEPVPDITVQGIVQRDYGVRGTDGAIQVTMPFPIFDRNQGAIRQARAESVAAEMQLQKLELDLQKRLAHVFEQYASARQRVEQYEQEILPLARESLDLTRAGYQSGELNYLAFLTAQRTYSQANIAFIEALGALRSAAWRIEGQLLSGGLNSDSAP
jgi:cobalt-zinc-cadmium efflux system outer membrane protein